MTKKAATQEASAQFDRWLAAHDTEIREGALSHVRAQLRAEAILGIEVDLFDLAAKFTGEWLETWLAGDASQAASQIGGQS